MDGMQMLLFIIKNQQLAWHYKQISKTQSLLQVQTRDNIKIKIIEKFGYTPYTIKDLGKYNKLFVEQEFEILLLCLLEI